jgi:hypothetical protein
MWWCESLSNVFEATSIATAPWLQSRFKITNAAACIMINFFDATSMATALWL